MDSMDTSRVVGVGALVLLSLTILLTLIQHPVLTLAVILVIFWLFLHPSEAEKFWKSAAPILVEAFTKAVQQANASGGEADCFELDGNVGKAGTGFENAQGESDPKDGAGKIVGDQKAGSTEIEEGGQTALKQSDKLGKSAEIGGGKSASQQGDQQGDLTATEGDHSDAQARNGSGHQAHDRPGFPPNGDPLLALDTLLDLEDDDGDIEIDPMSQSDQVPKHLNRDNPDQQKIDNAKNLDQPDLLKGANPRDTKSVPPPPPPRPDKPKSELQFPQPTDQPDVLILNSPAQATYRRQFGGNGEDEFYVTSVDYEQFEFEPLIITEQVPKTTEYFEKLTAKKKRELMKDQEMRARLSRSMSRPPYP